ncbi:MAG TPA: hypothetical protein DCY03_01870 [Planctomycetaceae bacterium]|nr:hypothetical protein [Planctomycetaceae bacterium]|tara:strand:- start:3558 stop:4040 length:483 start_codon:yes stop_codon:yes gene_type:complete
MRNITGILTSQTIKRLQHVKSGTCLLIDPECSILEIKEITKPRDLSASDVELLCKLMLDANSWYRCKKRCIPRNTAIISLDSPSGNVDVLIGIPCHHWRILKPLKESGAFFFFDPIIEEIQMILKRTFPDLASPYKRSMWKQSVIRKLCINASQSKPEKD